MVLMNGVIRMTPTNCKQYSYHALAFGHSQPLLCIAVLHLILWYCMTVFFDSPERIGCIQNLNDFFSELVKPIRWGQTVSRTSKFLRMIRFRSGIVLLYCVICVSVISKMPISKKRSSIHDIVVAKISLYWTIILFLFKGIIDKYYLWLHF